MAVMPEHLIAKIKADALREAADEFYDADRLSTTTWLRERAEKLVNPKPAVELPTEPTWGWLTYRDTDYPSANPTVELGEWKVRDDRATVLDVHGSTSLPLRWATAFTPATAVPTSALDELWKQRRTWGLGIVLNSDQLAIRFFLEAVTKAATS